jgi:mono/diheme cytochrome c family protein
MADAAGAGPTTEHVVCLAAHAEAIPARSEVVSADAKPSDKPVFTSDLFSLFQSNCGGCHVEATLGGFDGQKVTLQNFSTLVDQMAVDAIRSNDPAGVMPPLGSDAGKLAKDRATNDPILGLASVLEEWIQAGRPSDVFYEKAQAVNGASPYLMSPELGAALTNLGNCIPDKAFVGTEQDKSKKLDDFFAHATALPQYLDATDLVSSDAAELAPYGVVAYAPGYPLWSDNAKKMRFVRVPRGQHIVFDKATQTFAIPINTRFYKTFLKEVTDQSGATAYKRIETRLIVSRPDSCDAQTGTCTPQALMGTYVWNDEETQAELLAVPLRDGEPFADRLITYVTDEQKAIGINDPQSAGLTRSYALPGSTRCVQCHMGSVSQSFVLGFAPIQIRRRPKGEGGVIEDTGDDELNQLKRLIDYGVITGVDSEDDIAKLEESQTTAPRNDYELTAQGYMLGNCGHCHNPRGFPSIQNPELSSILQFWPDMHGGIFHFPLDRVSPRIRRGILNDVQLPYITPSLHDLLGDPNAVIPGTTIPIYTPKITFAISTSGGSTSREIKAPWRSLIYRNVDTPFTYSEDYAIYPHMPFNTAGYDCRVTQILGDWMVSIPAETALGAVDIGQTQNSGQTSQPFVEVTVENDGQDAYDKAVRDATARLADYHAGDRYGFCPDTSDIVDPEVVSGQYLVPQDNGYPLKDFPSILQKDGVPDRAHWVVTDPTEVPGDWKPRRADWADFILNLAPDRVALLDDDKREALAVLTKSDLRVSDDFRAFALHELPLALWDTQNGACDQLLAAEPTPSAFAGDDAMRWLTGTTASDPVYTTSIGATVFTQICRNCHGSQADGQSTLANTLLNLTGGVSRVADLHDGLFGPDCTTHPSDGCTAGSFRPAIFGDSASQLGLQTDDLAGRYLAWMALGGTEKPIPDAVLVQVANAPAFGVARQGTGNAPPPSANMLAAARQHCRDFLNPSIRMNVLTIGTTVFGKAGVFSPDMWDDPNFGWVWRNGDEEMWERICARDNPPPVFALHLFPKDDWSQQSQNEAQPYGFYRRSAYPAGAPVGGIDSVQSGLSDGNRFPWCLMVDPHQAQNPDLAPAYAASHLLGGQPLPICPSALIQPENQLSDTDITDWSIRGAANAGLAVFSYIDALAHRTVVPKVLFNECNKLNASGP